MRTPANRFWSLRLFIITADPKLTASLQQGGIHAVLQKSQALRNRYSADWHKLRA
jgi:hypothetical protein